MPIYEYKCDACGVEIELQQKMSDPHPSRCEACGKGPMTKLMSMTSFVLKGTGWYTTDFRDKGKSAGTGSGSASAPSTPSKSQTEPATATDSKATPASSEEKAAPAAKPADHKTES